ncbi:hypothetical protein EPJ66_10635 [Brachyspira aalborgi]|uniref:Uncharacterized protein n=1 Tax=Brachyspira aalborgi TaxID=29522 RepID=A0A5C8FL91_9SPIR|nr:hypothetical protein [Brachyspira aalborgi]TXJ35663.1 hypothetical protein EPJ81_11560 [Brachyspira aalborgi]TXJ50154.1 hypothetical protein EPJ66_10635 [Brachyspira aalborgi]
MFDDNKLKVVLNLLSEIEKFVAKSSNNDKYIAGLIKDCEYKVLELKKQNKYLDIRKNASLEILTNLCQDLKSQINPKELLELDTIKLYLTNKTIPDTKNWDKNYKTIIEYFLNHI